MLCADPPLQGSTWREKLSEIQAAYLSPWSLVYCGQSPGAFSKIQWRFSVSVPDNNTCSRYTTETSKRNLCHHRYLLNYELINHFNAIFWQPIASAVVAYTAKKASGQSQCKKRKSLQWTTWEGSVHSLQTYSEQQSLRTTNYWWSNDTNNNYNDSDTIQNAKVDKTVS